MDEQLLRLMQSEVGRQARYGLSLARRRHRSAFRPLRMQLDRRPRIGSRRGGNWPPETLSTGSTKPTHFDSVRRFVRRSEVRTAPHSPEHAPRVGRTTASERKLPEAGGRIRTDGLLLTRQLL